MTYEPWERWEWWVSSPVMTIFVATVDGRIIDAAPIVRRFLGQDMGHLITWLERRTGAFIDCRFINLTM